MGGDSGTLDRWTSRSLAAGGIMGTTMLGFARGSDGAPLPPSRWRRNCMATVGTHDMPPAAAFRTGEQVTIRARLGLLKQPEDSERNAAGLMLSHSRDALAREGLIGAGPLPRPDQFTVALYGHPPPTPPPLVRVPPAD